MCIIGKDGYLSQGEIEALLKGLDNNSKKKTDHRWYFITEDIDDSDDSEENTNPVTADRPKRTVSNKNIRRKRSMRHLDYLNRAIKEIYHMPEPNKEKDTELITAVYAIIELSHVARKEGLLALEEVVISDADDKTAPLMTYLRTVTGLIIDGNDPELVEEIGYNMLIGSQAVGYEALIRLIYLKGMLSIQAGENPRMIAVKLMTMLPEWVLELLRKDCGNDDNDDYDFYFIKSPSFPPIFRKKKKDDTDAKKKDPIEELCSIEKIALNDTDECYFEMRILEHMLKTMDDNAIQRVLREFGNEDIELMMKGLSGEANACIIRNLSHNKAILLAEEVVFMEPVRLKDVRDAGRKILETMLKLEMRGEIIITDGKAAGLFLELLKEYDMDQEKERKIRNKETELERLFKQFKRIKNGRNS